MKDSLILIQSGRTAARVAIPFVWFVVVTAVYQTAKTGTAVLEFPVGLAKDLSGPWWTFTHCFIVVCFGLIAHVVLAALICYIEKQLREY